MGYNVMSIFNTCGSPAVVGGVVGVREVGFKTNLGPPVGPHAPLGSARMDSPYKSRKDQRAKKCRPTERSLL